MYRRGEDETAHFRQPTHSHRLLHVDTVRIIHARWKMIDSGPIGSAERGQVILQRAHRLRAQVSTLVQTVHESAADKARMHAFFPATSELFQGVEDCLVRHLPADRADLDSPAPEKLFQRSLELQLLIHDEVGTLVIADVRCIRIRAFRSPVLVVAGARFRNGQFVDIGRCRLLRWYEIYAFLTSPMGIGPGVIGEHPGQSCYAFGFFIGYQRHRPCFVDPRLRANQALVAAFSFITSARSDNLYTSFSA